MLDRRILAVTPGAGPLGGMLVSDGEFRARGASSDAGLTDRGGTDVGLDAPTDAATGWRADAASTSGSYRVSATRP